MPELATVTAYVAWAIFADYDANAPTTEDLLTVGTEDLAKELTELFNRNPRAVPLACVDGWEHCKSYDYRRVLLEGPEGVAWSRQEALETADLTEEELAADGESDEG